MSDARPEDAYSRAALGWATGAAQVYQPLAGALVAHAPHPLTDRLVLDACAGTGCGGVALEHAGARVVATDLSEGMLRHHHGTRPPAAVSDVCRLAIGNDRVDDTILPFVLNHLPDPAQALAEAARVTRPGGAVLATVFSNTSRSAARDQIDEVALSEGFQPPAWYIALKDSYAASIGTADTLQGAALDAGLAAVEVDELETETGLADPVALVEYRFSMAQYAVWLAGLSPDHRDRLRRRAIDEATPLMAPYRPIVLFLVALSR